MRTRTAGRLGRIGAAMVMAGFLSSAVAGLAQTGRTGQPESVIVKYHARAGSESALAAVIARHWETARRLNLVHNTPHLTIRGAEDGDRTYLAEIFTWRDAGIPDAAPAEIQAIWAEMNKLVESRGGRPGIELAEVSIIAAN